MMSILKTLLSGHGARLVCQRCILDSLKLSSSGRVSVPGFGHSIRTISTNGRSIVREKQSSYFRKPSFGPLPPTERTNPSQQRVRTFSSTPTTRSNVDLEKVIGEITDLYGEAKDELEYAVEARGTTYYNDDKAAAAEAVDKVLSSYHSAISSLPESAKTDLERRIGLKVLELKAQFDELTKDDIEGDDH